MRLGPLGQLATNQTAEQSPENGTSALEATCPVLVIAESKEIFN